MQNCIDYNCTDDIQAQVLNDCAEQFAGGIAKAIILTCDTELVDPSDAVDVQLEIDASRAFIYENLKVGMPAPSPITQGSYVSCGIDQTTNYDRTLTWTDINANDPTIDSYNVLNTSTGKQAGGVILFLCGEDDGKVLFIDDALRWEGGLIIPDNDDDSQRFEFIVKWRAKIDSRKFDAPVLT